MPALNRHDNPTNLWFEIKVEPDIRSLSLAVPQKPFSCQVRAAEV
jgi:hypothetical protein